MKTHTNFEKFWEDAEDYAQTYEEARKREEKPTRRKAKPIMEGIINWAYMPPFDMFIFDISNEGAFDVHETSNKLKERVGELGLEIKRVDYFKIDYAISKEGKEVAFLWGKEKDPFWINKDYKEGGKLLKMIKETASFKEIKHGLIPY